MSKKYKIGIYGSASGDIKPSMHKAVALGKALRDYADRLILITGACTGLPYAVLEQAAQSGIEIWGFSSSLDHESQEKEYPDDDISVYTKLIYIPKDYPYADDPRICKKYRNVTSTVACDAGIFLAGSWGTLNEFTNVTDFHKPSAVLTGTGGISDELPGLTSKIHKAGQGPVIFDDDPAKLIRKLLEVLETSRDT